MNRQLVIHLGLSVCAAAGAAGACLYAGGGLLVSLAVYCLVGSITLLSLAAAAAAFPDRLRRRVAAPERVYA